MTKPKSFITNTDYGTLKASEKIIQSLNVPGSINLPSNTEWVNSTDIPVSGVDASTPTSQISASRSGIWYAANRIRFLRTASDGFPYYMSCDIVRSSRTVITISARIFNPAPVSMTTQSGSETITFELTDILAPFA